MPFQASKRGSDLTWTMRGMPAPPWVVENWPGSATILALRSKGFLEGKPIDETRYCGSSLRTAATSLLRHVRDRWSYGFAEDAGAGKHHGDLPGQEPYARLGIIVNTTPAEASWEGHLTLEFSNSSAADCRIYANEGICQWLFFEGDP